MTSPEQTNGMMNNLKRKAQSSDVQGNPPKVPRSDVTELDKEETHQQQIPSTEKVESLAGRTSPQEEVSHPDSGSILPSLLEKRKEETSNTAVKRVCPNPSPEVLGAEQDRREEAPIPADNGTTPPSSSESDPDSIDICPRWRYWDILFDPHRRGNGCFVTPDCTSVFNSEEVNDCPDVNRKAGTWGCELLSVNHLNPSQYWYLSIRVFPRSQDTLFPGTLCEVGVGTEYALRVLKCVSESARARYIKSTVSFNYAAIQRLAQANGGVNNSQEANEQRPPLRVDLGFYWNIERRRVHILHLAHNGFTLLYRDNVGYDMDIWPVLSVAPLSKCNMEVEIRVLSPEECPFAPYVYRHDLQAIVDAPV